MPPSVPLLAVLVVGLLMASSEASACSCASPPDLREALTSARERAQAIFRGRVTRIEVEDDAATKRPRLHRVFFQVGETFKGKALPQRRVATYSANGVGCGYLFTPGLEYLVYAGADEKEGLETSICTRTKPAEGIRSELDFLRKGVLPSRPVALRREQVACTECDGHTQVKTLVCGSAESCEPLAPPKDITAALGEKRPFWSYSLVGPGQGMALYGVAGNGRAFTLVRRPSYEAEEACLRRVYRRWCERLTRVPNPSGGWPEVECVGAEPEELLCDETATRRASWGPVESMLPARCDWRNLDTPGCGLSADPSPLTPGQPTGPGLLCTPRSLGFSYHQCQRVPEVARPPPENSRP